MNWDETAKLMAVLQIAYPQYYRNVTDADARTAIALWQEVFSEDDATLVAMATKAFIAADTKGFPPSIGIIKEQVYKLSQPQEMTEMEAWNLVVKALRNSGYHSGKEFDKLPPTIQRLVGSPAQLREWALMDSDQVGTVVQSNFMRSYRARVHSEREFQKIPSNVKNALGDLREQLSMNRMGIEHGKGDD